MRLGRKKRPGIKGDPLPVCYKCGEYLGATTRGRKQSGFQLDDGRMACPSCYFGLGRAARGPSPAEIDQAIRSIKKAQDPP